MERVAVFIDGESFYVFQKEGLGWRIDPGLLLDYLDKQFPSTDSRPCPNDYPQTHVDLAYYYWISSGSLKEEKFARYLAFTGYAVRKRIWTEEEAQYRRPPNMLCEMVVDIVAMMDSYDHAVIVSGDNDIARALEVLRDRNKKFTIMGVQQLVGFDVWNLIGPHFIHLDELRPLVEKKKNGDYLETNENFNQERLVDSVSYG